MTPEANLTFGQLVILANLPDVDSAQFASRVVRLLKLSTQQTGKTDDQMSEWLTLVKVIRTDLSVPAFVEHVNKFLAVAGQPLIAMPEPMPEPMGYLKRGFRRLAEDARRKQAELDAKQAKPLKLTGLDWANRNQMENE